MRLCWEPTRRRSPTPTSYTSGDFTYSADPSNVPAGATVTGYSGPSDVTIPASVSLGSPAVVYAVTSIGAAAFQVDGLTSVTIPDSVTSIDEEAFEDNDLTSVMIPDSVTSIADHAFAVNDLTSVTIGDSVTSIGGAAFEDDDLTSVIIPDSVTSIGEYAFYNNDLTAVTIPDSVTSIGNDAFFENGLTSLTIGDSVTSIGAYAFFEDNLTSVIIPGSVNSIGAEAFGNNSGLESVTFLGAAPTTIGAATGTDSLGDTFGLTVSYNWAYDAAQVAGGYTTPTWEGYTTLERATVSFNLGAHGTAIAAQDVTVGSTATQPADPAAPGFIFNGWYTNAALTTPANFTDPITTNTTLYAGWSALAVTGVNINPLTLPLTAGILLLGIALILVSRRRTRTVPSLPTPELN